MLRAGELTLVIRIVSLNVAFQKRRVVVQLVNVYLVVACDTRGNFFSNGV